MTRASFLVYRVGNDAGLSRGFHEATAVMRLGFRGLPEGPRPADSDALAVHPGRHPLPGLTLLRSVTQCGEFWLEGQSCWEHMPATPLRELPGQEVTDARPAAPEL